VFVLELVQVTGARFERLTVKAEKLPRCAGDLKRIFIVRVSMPAFVSMSLAFSARRDPRNQNTAEDGAPHESHDVKANSFNTEDFGWRVPFRVVRLARVLICITVSDPNVIKLMMRAGRILRACAVLIPQFWMLLDCPVQPGHWDIALNQTQVHAGTFIGMD
jgi:hypothetical protein